MFQLGAGGLDPQHILERAGFRGFAATPRTSLCGARLEPEAGVLPGPTDMAAGTPTRTSARMPPEFETCTVAVHGLPGFDLSKRECGWDWRGRLDRRPMR